MTGYCPNCEKIQNVDYIDELFDLRPSCEECGEWLNESLPSADDLDRVAEEESVREATNG